MADDEAKIDLGIPGLGPAEHIGRGGFADVYRAEQLSLRRTVAVKVLRAQASDADGEARFQRECHAIGAVSDHPHIVGVHEGGFTRNGRAYLVMEYLPGGSLADRLAEYGPMPVGQIVDTGIKIARALAVAHRAGVLHRDVKPANIMISAYGEPALGDFGIARVEGGHQTASGVVTASFAHAAPEVLEGQPAGPTADVYSLGSTMFELLTGRAPYYRSTDETVWPLMKRILSEPMPSPESVGMSRQLGRVFNRATARSPGERYLDANELADDLEIVAAEPAALMLHKPIDLEQLGLGSGPDGGETAPVAGGFLANPRTGAGAQDGPPQGAKPDLTSLRRAPTVSLPDPTAGLSVTADPGLVVPEPVVERPQRSAGQLLGAVIVGLGVAAIAAIGGLWYLGTTDDGSGGVAGDLRLTVTGADQGPVRPDVPLEVDVQRLPGATYQLLVDGAAIGQPADEPPAPVVGPGRHDIAYEVTTGDGAFRTRSVAVYATPPIDTPGYRVALASVDQADGWTATLAIYDQLVADGHERLDLVATDSFGQLTAGHWWLYVDGFGDDAAAADAYCVDWALPVPARCNVSYVDPLLTGSS